MVGYVGIRSYHTEIPMHNSTVNVLVALMALYVKMVRFSVFVSISLFCSKQMVFSPQLLLLSTDRYSGASVSI